MKTVDANQALIIECPECYEELLCYEEVRGGDEVKCPSCGKTSKIADVTVPYRGDKNPVVLKCETRV